MTVSHLKRKVAPKTWNIARKQQSFVTRPKPKGQPMELTIPVVLALRDLLKLVESADQCRRLLRTTQITVNGTRVYDVDAAIGFMDILSAGGHTYRLVLNANNQLALVPVKKGEEVTIQRIIGKSTLTKGKVQLNLSSGANIVIAKDSYKVGDSVALDLTGKITAHYPLAQGASVFILRGSHIAAQGVVESIDKTTKTITITVDGKGSVTTATRYAYVLGTKSPAITIA